jgi:MYXO-CTERM domain-containing protein
VQVARSSKRLRAGALLTLALVLGGASPAAAFVRTRTPTQAPYFHSSPQLVLEVAVPPDTLPISAADVRGAAQAAIDTWSHPAISCTSLSLTLAPGLVDGQVAAYDGHNRIVMRSGAWCRDPDALTDCHDASQVALTTSWTIKHPGAFDDGQILEADIEINDVDYQWGIIPEGPISGRDYEYIYDLTSALTHETGHFIGLAHVCELPGDPVRVDNHGATSPDCTDVATVTAEQLDESTMYPTMGPADVSLRTLTDDDMAAACFVYPAVPTVVGSCDVTPTGQSPGLPIALAASLGLLLVAVRRPRRP